MRRKIVIIIKSLCDTILYGQPKLKKTLVFHYSIDMFQLTMDWSKFNTLYNLIICFLENSTKV